jgi:hypothetical protein
MNRIEALERCGVLLQRRVRSSSSKERTMAQIGALPLREGDTRKTHPQRQHEQQ